MDDATLIQRLLAPVLIIPACGLLILSTSARLSALLARIRVMHGERLEALRAGVAGDGLDSAIRRMRFEGLEAQTHRMLRRAAMQRNALQLLFLAVMAMGASSLLLGLALVAPFAEWVAGAAFVGGLALVIGAMGYCFAEMSGALRPIRYEHERVEQLCAAHGAES